MTNIPTTIYELGLSYRASWQAHSQSNAGSNGSNRVMPRRQLLADGTETDACSGNIAKHYHAALTAEYLEEASVPLCPACRQRDSRRAAALVDHPDDKSLTIERILTGCGLCDIHGFLVTSRNATSDGSTEARQRLSKATLVEYAFALARPDQHTETPHLFTRIGDSKDAGQMLMKMSARSGALPAALHKP
jgi:CRISPR/Cas system-associated protein Cas7 (RAMP superfamily)